MISKKVLAVKKIYGNKELNNDNVYFSPRFGLVNSLKPMRFIVYDDINDDIFNQFSIQNNRLNMCVHVGNLKRFSISHLQTFFLLFLLFLL